MKRVINLKKLESKDDELESYEHLIEKHKAYLLRICARKLKNGYKCTDIDSRVKFVKV